MDNMEAECSMVDAEIESDENKRERLSEYEKMLGELQRKSHILEQHGINPNALIKLLTREINVLRHQLGL